MTLEEAVTGDWFPRNNEFQQATNVTLTNQDRRDRRIRGQAGDLLGTGSSIPAMSSRTRN